MNMEALFDRLEKGDKKAAGRLMTLLEDEGPDGDEALRRLYAGSGKATVIGVTGWPGVGKSSLVGRMAKVFLSEGKGVGIIAVDPTSPFSGGGILGDRIRFREIEGNERLFIRSVATRGCRGGLSHSARAFIKVLEVMGNDVVLLETVGIGQDQVSVGLVADTTIVVVAPGLGDYLQAIKSGVLEIGDIFVVNKADRFGADGAASDLEAAVRMRQTDGWRPIVVKTVAIDGRGVEALVTEIGRHHAYRAKEWGVPATKICAASEEIREAVGSRLLDHFYGSHGLKDDSMAQQALDVCERRIDPYVVADTILKERGIV